MKANEFIKEHGLQYTKSIIDQFPKHTHVTNDGRMFIDEATCCNHIKRQLDGVVKMGELKRLVESHELIESYGGLDVTKNNHKYCFVPDCKIEQAILDVESCR